MIDDVESFVAAAEVLKENGACKIYVLATHGLLSSDAPRLIEESPIDEVFIFVQHIFRFILNNFFVSYRLLLPIPFHMRSKNYNVIKSKLLTFPFLLPRLYAAYIIKNPCLICSVMLL